MKELFRVCVGKCVSACIEHPRPIAAVLRPILCLALALPVAQAQISISTDWQDYAIVGQSTVSLNSYSTALGNVYAADDLTLEFGYGIQVPSQNAGSFFTRGDFVENSLSDVNGNVAANGNLT